MDKSSSIFLGTWYLQGILIPGKYFCRVALGEENVQLWWGESGLSWVHGGKYGYRTPGDEAGSARRNYYVALSPLDTGDQGIITVLTQDCRD